MSDQDCAKAVMRYWASPYTRFYPWVRANYPTPQGPPTQQRLTLGSRGGLAKAAKRGKKA